MKYKIKRIPIELKFNEVIEFEAEQLCKVINVDAWDDGATVVVMERWGQVHSRLKKHKIIIMEEDVEIDYEVPYEPTFSRRDFLVYHGKTYYVFGIS